MKYMFYILVSNANNEYMEDLKLYYQMYYYIFILKNLKMLIIYLVKKIFITKFIIIQYLFR